MSNGSMVKNWVHDGTNWQKLGLLFGYNDTYQERVAQTGAAGSHYLSSTAVPSGYIYVITNIWCRNINTNVNISIFKDINDTRYEIDVITQIAISDGVKARMYQPIYLKEDDKITVYFFDCVANDPLRLCVQGYKMKIS